MQVTFDYDVSRGNPKDRLQCCYNLGTLQATVSVENEAVGRCFIHDPATRPFIILC